MPCLEVPCFRGSSTKRLAGVGACRHVDCAVRAFGGRKGSAGLLTSEAAEACRGRKVGPCNTQVR